MDQEWQTGDRLEFPGGRTNVTRSDEQLQRLLQEERLLSIKETAQMLGVSESTVKKLLDRGEIPCVRIFRSLRFPLSLIREFIRERIEYADPETEAKAEDGAAS
jgi:excisionase family DNA binding protein